MGKKTEPDEAVEKVEGRVEGLTYSEEEQRIRKEARERAMARDSKLYGTNKMSAVTGQIVRNRAMGSGTREAEYSCGAELAGFIDAYWIQVYQDQEHGSNIIPDTEHLADYLGITRNTLMRWARGEANLEFAPPLQIALSEIATFKKQFAYTDKVNGLVYLSDIQNNHGYLSNKTDTRDVNVNVRLHDMPSIDQLNEQVKLLP